MRGIVEEAVFCELHRLHFIFDPAWCMQPTSENQNMRNSQVMSKHGTIALNYRSHADLRARCVATRQRAVLIRSCWRRLDRHVRAWLRRTLRTCHHRRLRALPLPIVL